MRAFVTVMHVGARFVVDSLRRSGVRAAYHRNDPEAEVPWFHFYEDELPEPAEAFTVIRSPLSVLASHDADGRPLRSMTRVLASSYARMIEYVELGAIACRIEDGLEPIAELLGLEDGITPARYDARDYPLKTALREGHVARELWRQPALLDWYLDELAWVDEWHAARGYEIFWR